MEAWRYAMRAMLAAVCVGSFVVTLATLGVRITQVGFLGNPPADSAAVAPPPPPPLSAQDSAAAAHPFAKLIPNDPPPAGVDTKSPTANGLLLGALGGIFASGLVAWWLLAPLGSVYRRGSLALTAGIGTLIGMMLAVPFDMLGRQPGLLLFLALLATAAWRLRRSIAGVEVVESPPAA